MNPKTVPGPGARPRMSPSGEMVAASELACRSGENAVREIAAYPSPGHRVRTIDSASGVRVDDKIEGRIVCVEPVERNGRFERVPGQIGDLANYLVRRVHNNGTGTAVESVIG